MIMHAARSSVTLRCDLHARGDPNEPVMPHTRVPKNWRIDYATLAQPHPMGQCMGSYAGHVIREAVVDGGQRYIYAGIAPRCQDGSIDVDALAPGEFIVPPGLIYRLETFPDPWWRRLI